MSRFFSGPLSVAVLFLMASSSSIAQEADAGARVFKKCLACHAVGEGAVNKVGPQLNSLLGRTAGSLEQYKYSNAMKKAGDDGLVWNSETLDSFLIKPKKMIKKTKMSFAGLNKDQDRANIIAYLKTFSTDNPEVKAGSKEEQSASNHSGQIQTPLLAKDRKIATHGKLHLGRKALKEEVAAWNIDVRPDGAGLPVGKGTVAQGEPIFLENCAICHGEFGEGVDRWPQIAGGFDTLVEDRPERTIGSYWPYLSTVFDYIKRAMPFGNARSLGDDDVYALTAYMLYLNNIVEDENFELSNKNFAEIKLPNEANFTKDNRFDEPHRAGGIKPCMSNCIPGKVTVISRAGTLNVTPVDTKNSSSDFLEFK